MEVATHVVHSALSTVDRPSSAMVLASERAFLIVGIWRALHV